MVTTRPYLIRAIYDWAEDNQFTPHILVDVTEPGVDVPTEFVQDNKIILNVSASAVAGLELGNDMIHFSARFAGVARDIFVPVKAVKAIYARENGMGLVLPDDPETAAADVEDADVVAKPEADKGSHLKVIK